MTADDILGTIDRSVDCYLRLRPLLAWVRMQARNLTPAEITQKVADAERAWEDSLAEHSRRGGRRGNAALNARERFTEWQRILAVARRSGTGRYNPGQDDGGWPAGERPRR